MENGIERVAHADRNTLVATEYLGSLASEDTSGHVFDWRFGAAVGYEHTDGETYKNLILMGGHDTIRGFNGNLDRIGHNGHTKKTIEEKSVNGEKHYVVYYYQNDKNEDFTLTLIDPILTDDQLNLLPSKLQLLAITDLNDVNKSEDSDKDTDPLDRNLLPEVSIDPSESKDKLNSYGYKVDAAKKIVTSYGTNASEDFRALLRRLPFAFYNQNNISVRGISSDDMYAHSMNGGPGDDTLYGSNQNDTIDGGGQGEHRKDVIWGLKGMTGLKCMEMKEFMMRFGVAMGSRKLPS